jgi:hypothetical protein
MILFVSQHPGFPDSRFAAKDTTQQQSQSQPQRKEALVCFGSTTGHTGFRSIQDQRVSRIAREQLL